MENQNLPIINWGERSESMAKFMPDFIKFQRGTDPVKKEAKNPFFKSTYADLSSLWDAIRERLADHNFGIFQEPISEGEKIGVATTLMHISGEFTRSKLFLPLVKQSAQDSGSAITYAKRYAIQAVLGIATEDDDGNAASGNSKPKYQAKPAPQPQGKSVRDLNAEQLEWLKNNGKTPEQRRAAEDEQARREESLMNQ